MDNIKNEEEMVTLILTVGIEMEFSVEKCVMLMMISRKRRMTEGIELVNQESKNARRKEKLQVLTNIGSGHKQTKKKKI